MVLTTPDENLLMTTNLLEICKRSNSQIIYKVLYV
mgnify:CR=1 FL=1